MTTYGDLEKARDEAKAAFYAFLDQSWFGTPDQRKGNLGNPDRYKQLRDQYDAAEAALQKGAPPSR